MGSMRPKFGVILGPKVGGQRGLKFGVTEAQLLGSMKPKSWGPMVEFNKAQRLASTRPKFGVILGPKVGGQQGLKFGVNEAQILGVNRAKTWDPMVDFNKAQRSAWRRPKVEVNQVKIRGQRERNVG